MNISRVALLWRRVLRNGEHLMAVENFILRALAPQGSCSSFRWLPFLFFDRAFATLSLLDESKRKRRGCVRGVVDDEFRQRHGAVFFFLPIRRVFTRLWHSGALKNRRKKQNKNNKASPACRHQRLARRVPAMENESSLAFGERMGVVIARGREQQRRKDPQTKPAVSKQKSAQQRKWVEREYDRA